MIARLLDLLTANEGQEELSTISVDGEEGTGELPTVTDAYAFVLLCHQTTGRTVVTGAAALAKPIGRDIAPVGVLAMRVSRMLVEKGDATPRT